MVAAAMLVLVLVPGDSAIGRNGALGQGRFWVMAPPPPAPFRFPSPSCFRVAAACELACRIHRRQAPGSSVSCILAGREDSLLRVVAAALMLPLERDPEERHSTAAELLGGHRRLEVLLDVDTVACLECRRPKGRASHVVGGFRRRRGGAGCRGAASRGESSVFGAAVGARSVVHAGST